MPGMAQKNDPSPPNMLLRAVAIRNDRPKASPGIFVNHCPHPARPALGHLDLRAMRSTKSRQEGLSILLECRLLDQLVEGQLRDRFLQPLVLKLEVFQALG
jgi:hypothetical protein